MNFIELFINSINFLIQNVINNDTLLSTLAGAGFGSWFGAKLSFWQKNKEEFSLNFLNFKALIFITNNLRDDISCFKRDLIIPKAEGLTEKDIILYLRKIANKIPEGSFLFDVNLSKYNFIGDKNPSIVSLIIAIKKSIKVVEDSIYKNNNLIDHYAINKPEGNIDINDKYRLDSSTNVLISSIDHLLYFTDLLLRALLLYKEKYYNIEKGNINYSELDNNLKYLIPRLCHKNTPLNWEQSVDNWVVETTFNEKYFPVFQKLFLFLIFIKKIFAKFFSHKIF